MTVIARGNVARLAFAFGLTAFLLFGTPGFSHAGMTTAMDGQMSDCPFTLGVAICNMTPLEMISASQSLLTTLPQGKDAFSLLASLIALAMAFAISSKRLVPPDVSAPYAFKPCSGYAPFSNPLQELFSNGILNPRLYESR